MEPEVCDTGVQHKNTHIRANRSLAPGLWWLMLACTQPGHSPKQEGRTICCQEYVWGPHRCRPNLTARVIASQQSSVPGTCVAAAAGTAGGDMLALDGGGDSGRAGGPLDEDSSIVDLVGDSTGCWLG